MRLRVEEEVGYIHNNLEVKLLASYMIQESNKSNVLFAR
jgi:hypothetical protein